MKKNLLFCALVTLLCWLTPSMAADSNQPTKRPIMVVETTQGSFEVELFSDVAPKASENFMKLAENNYYNGTVFHRVIPGFMVQGGDPTGTGAGGNSVWGKTFEDEFKESVKFEKSRLLAMANRGPNTNGSQFFITTAATPWLNQKHTIFGEVISGYDTVKKIESYGTRSGKPSTVQSIVKVYLKK